MVHINENDQVHTYFNHIFHSTICSKTVSLHNQVVFNELSNKTIDDDENGIDTRLRCQLLGH